tara:strand:- start:2339 stop:2575 length:237 start_codon:yes stop_codon:yes gene_type:complete
MDERLVKVIWLDAYESSAGWHDLEDAKDLQCPVCLSVGWIVHMDNQRLVIAADKESSDASRGRLQALPWGMIMEIENL